MNKKIYPMLILILLLMGSVSADSAPAGQQMGSIEKLWYSTGLGFTFNSMGDAITGFLADVNVIFSFIALGLAFLLFIFVTYTLYIWLPLKIYPVYRKYINLIQLFLNETKL